MRALVGISQKIRRAWLDAVLDRLATTTNETDLRAFLDEFLQADLPGPESRAKAAGIVLRIWSGIPPKRSALREQAVAMLPRIAGQERIWLHWGMTALAYPFFRDTAEVIGRLLALQDDFTTAQVQGRMLTTWGDRDTNKEAVQKLITSLVDWDVLRSTKTKGHFLLARKLTASAPELQIWLLEALLGASAADEVEAQQLLRLPEAFPFAIKVGVADLRAHERFNIHRQGLDMDMVALRELKHEQLQKPERRPRREKSPEGEGRSLFDNVTEGAVSMGPGHEIVVDHPFAAPLAECDQLLREGHHFGCIALSYDLLEAVVLRVWQAEFKTGTGIAGDFQRNVDALHAKKVISDDWKTTLDRMWALRHSCYLLRPEIEADQQQLAELARDGLRVLGELVQ